jgi:soluble lytic murein transglycosylase-like protein
VQHRTGSHKERSAQAGLAHGRTALAGIVGAALALSCLLALSVSAGPSEAPTVEDQPAPPPVVAEEPAPSQGHKVLSDNDVFLYSQIFRDQDDALWSRADQSLAQIEDRALVGHVLADRYLERNGYKVKYSQLAEWLENYADHPQASEIHALAQRLHPKGKPWPRTPIKVQIKTVLDSEPDFIPPRANPGARRKVATIQRNVKRYIGAGKPSAALKLLDSAKSQKDLTPIESDEIRQWIAAAFFFAHADERAFALAHDVAERRRAQVPIADWIAGLAGWRLGKVESAARHFELLADASDIGPWLRSGGAYWAARANLVAGLPERVSRDLRIAAKAPSTFYGLLALRQLGEVPSFTWELPAVSEDEFARALEIKAVRRAVALAQIGETERADLEMRRGHALAPSDLDRALIALAAENQLAAAQLHVAETSATTGFDGALYPIPAYRPQNGFTVDPALLYAFMRQESRFKPQAKSHAGAAGLMQIMPTTAALIARDRSLKKRNRARLYDPAYNLRLAQTYIEQLLKVTEPKGNLFMLAVAYNGGPGNLRRWFRKMEIQDDPLLFIESIPSRETRNYVERVLANMWIYRDRLGQPTPSLDMVAAGEWPVYEAQEPDLGPHASAGGGAVALERR